MFLQIYILEIIFLLITLILIFSGGNLPSSSHNNAILSNSILTNISNGNNFSLVTDDPSIVQRASRVRKPPDRYGE
jgi:hypothetical protein